MEATPALIDRLVGFMTSNPRGINITECDSEVWLFESIAAPENPEEGAVPPPISADASHLRQLGTSLLVALGGVGFVSGSTSDGDYVPPASSGSSASSGEDTNTDSSGEDTNADSSGEDTNADSSAEDTNESKSKDPAPPASLVLHSSVTHIYVGSGLVSGASQAGASQGIVVSEGGSAQIPPEDDSA